MKRYEKCKRSRNGKEFALQLCSQAEDMSSTDSGFESVLGAMRGAEDRHVPPSGLSGTVERPPSDCCTEIGEVFWDNFSLVSYDH